jgi:hypothetical protein
MSEDRVLLALRALRDADAVERLAGPELEARLMQAFRQRKRRVWGWTVAGIAAGLVGLAALMVEVERPKQVQVAVVLPAPVLVAEAAPLVPTAQLRPRPVRPAKPAPPLREVVTEFYPLMDFPPPFERGELVRVNLSASAVRDAGFMVEGSGPDDSVEAEVLVGQEGLARAIRFVSYRQ